MGKVNDYLGPWGEAWLCCLCSFLILGILGWIPQASAVIELANVSDVEVVTNQSFSIQMLYKDDRTEDVTFFFRMNDSAIINGEVNNYTDTFSHVGSGRHFNKLRVGVIVFYPGTYAVSWGMNSSDEMMLQSFSIKATGNVSEDDYVATLKEMERLKELKDYYAARTALKLQAQQQKEQQEQQEREQQGKEQQEQENVEKNITPPQVIEIPEILEQLPEQIPETEPISEPISEPVPPPTPSPPSPGMPFIEKLMVFSSVMFLFLSAIFIFISKKKRKSV